MLSPLLINTKQLVKYCCCSRIFKRCPESINNECNILHRQRGSPYPPKAEPGETQLEYSLSSC